MIKLLSIIVPAYNEAESIEPLVKEILSVAGKTPLEIILIDDGSKDHTAQVMKDVAKVYGSIRPQVKIKYLSYKLNRGKSAAVSAGIKLSQGNYIALMDADLQDDPAYLPKFAHNIIKNNVDLVVGYRVNRYRDNVIKRISSLVVNRIMSWASSYSIHDMNCGYKIMTREVALKLNLKTDYHRFIPLITVMNGFSVGEMIIDQKERRFGDSKYGKTGLVRAVVFIIDFLSLTFIYKFREKPFKLFGKVGLTIFGAGFIISLYLTIRWFMGYEISGRPLFFLGILLLILGVNIIGLGLLGELITYNRDNNI